VKDETKQALFEHAAVGPKLVADALNVSINSVYGGIGDGTVPAEKVKGQYRTPTAWLRKVLHLGSEAAA
jgi:hypothetical protein